MHLSLGLHQFLQLKHQTKLSPESLKCVFMSNHCYFAKHAGTVFGITGTLGGDEEMSLLFDLYGVEFFAMPRYKLNKRIEEETVVVHSQYEWMAAILESVKSHKTEQPILIIAENIANHKLIQTALRGERIVDDADLIDYSSSERHTDVLKKISMEADLKKGSIVLSTNLGGRGTDLKIDKDAKKMGMHVILTFLPPNLRVEKQAFGRTARAGENGTVQFILWTKEKQKRIDSSKVNNHKQNNEDVASIYYLKEERKRREIKRLKVIQEKVITKIKIQDELFMAYSNFRRQEIQQSIIFMQHKKQIRKLQLEFLDNRWAIWLDSIREPLDHLHLNKGLQHGNIWKQFDVFKKEMIVRMENKNDVKMFAEFTSEFVKIGTTYERIAMKWLVSSIISGDYSATENIFDEWKDNIQSLWKGTKATLTASKSLLTKWDATEAKQLIEQLSEKLNAEKPPTELELGMEVLKLASESEEKFSHPASLYKGMLALQQNSTGKFNAKQSLLEARERIHSRIEFNYSSLTMLDDACKEMEKNEENVNIGPNKFREQILNENNLLHIHLDAIQSTLHSPITEKFLKTQLPGVDSNDGAKKLLDFLLQEKWNLMKDCRISKQVSVDDLSGKITMKKKVLNNFSIPCLETFLANVINKGKSENSRVVRPTDFENIVVTREQFLDELKDKEMLDEDITPVYIIKENKVHDVNVQTFIDSLKKYEEIIIPRLKRSVVEIYKSEDILEKLSLTENESEELILTLKRLGWIENTELLIKPSAELNYLILSEEDSEYIEFLDDKTKAFRLSDLYQLYKKLLILKGIPQPIPKDSTHIDIDSFPFPIRRDIGAIDIFNTLRSHGVIKDPRVIFPDIHAEEQVVKNRLKEIRKRFSDAVFLEELKKLFVVVFNEEEDKFDQFKQRLFELLKDSVGTLKKHPKVRVNYECISTKVSLENDSTSDELQECLKEGVFDRIIALDEYVTILENTGSWLIVVAGAAEIGLGVATEILSFGALSPIAQFLISEGASDATYAFKQFYRGNRIDNTEFKAMKIESMKWSLCTCFILGGALRGDLAVVGGKSLLRLLTERLAMEMGMAGSKALMYSFIEDNIEKGIKDNVFGIRLILDNIFNSLEMQIQSNNFAAKCDALFAVCWEKNQAKDILTKIVSNVISDDRTKDTSYNLQIDKTFEDLKTTFYKGMANSLAKNVLPVSKSNVFGSNRELGGRCQTELGLLVINTMMAINSQMDKKISKINEMKRELLYAQESAVVQDQNEFQEWKSHITSKLKEDLRSEIVAVTYRTLTHQTMKKSLHESIRSGYKRVINAHDISAAKFWSQLEEEEDMENSEKLSMNDNYSHLEEKKRFTLVKNARGRNILEVETEWIKLEQSLGDIEFLTDTYGNTFITLRSENSMKHHFVLSKEEASFGNYLMWRNESDVLN